MLIKHVSIPRTSIVCPSARSFENTERIWRIFVAQEVIVRASSMSNEHDHVMLGGISRDTPADELQQVVWFSGVSFPCLPSNVLVEGRFSDGSQFEPLCGGAESGWIELRKHTQPRIITKTLLNLIECIDALFA